MLRTLLFTCAICGRDVFDGWYPGTGRWRQMAPVCIRCERDYAGPAPKAGSFTDRRRACQLSALAEALGCEASRRDYEATDPFGRTHATA